MKTTGGVKRYTPEWEPVERALGRCITLGLSETEAKSDLCYAIADGKVGIRVTIAKSGRIFLRENVRVPAHLSPVDIDWQESRPASKWWIGPAIGQHYAWLGDDLLEIARLEVSVADLLYVLGVAVPENGLLQQEGKLSDGQAERYSSPTRRRGAPPKYQWSEVESEAMRLMDHHGEFSDDDPDWNSQARLEEALAKFCQREFDAEPAISSLRAPNHIPAWLANWRSMK